MEPEESSSPTKKPLDPLVKTALSISVGLIVITVIGMILTAPDRSIPPYSVMAQAGDIVTVSVPPGTTDTEIEALLVRFRAIRSEGREFQRLKIKPTTPKEPNARYDRQRVSGWGASQYRQGLVRTGGARALSPDTADRIRGGWICAGGC